MSLNKLAVTAGALGLGLAMVYSTVTAQGPLYDTVNVTFPYTVTIGERTLQPGDYIIRQLPSAGDSPVLLIYSDGGMKFETSAMTIPTLDNRTPSDTTVVLHRYGNDYYFDKIWIQGKNYGYEFPLPDAVKARSRERAEPVSMAAKYEAAPAQTAQAAPAAPAAPAGPSEADLAAQAERDRLAREQADRDRLAAEQAERDRLAREQADRDRLAAEQAERDRLAQQAQARPPAEPATQPAAPAELPNTAANWAMMLLSGGVLSTAGFLLRRR
jgi:LPXTG-motif cell wall-anchored protein